jgi:uncharacterized OB-fold protein
LGADAEYWKALHQGVVKMQRCTGCGQWHWPAVWRCGECGSWEQGWHAVAPAGRIFSWTRNWHDFGWSSPVGLPYVPVAVELDGAGGRRLLGVLDSADGEVCIGQRVTGQVQCIEWAGESVPALRWTRVASAQGAAR